MLARIACLLSGFFLAAALAEIVLHALPYSTGYGPQGIDEQHPVVLGTAHRPYTYSRDWSFHFANSGVLNNRGFRATYDYVPDTNAIAVIGNSFVQADQLTPDLRMTERLGSLLRRNAYALGIDGFSLADYLAATKWTVAQLQTRTVLVLLTTEDLVRSCQRNTGQHYLRFADGQVSMGMIERPDPSWAKDLLNHSSLFRYLFDNLHAPANWVRGWRREDHGPPVTPLAPKAGSQAPSEEGQASPATGHATGCASAPFLKAATRYLLSAFREIESTTGAEVIFVLAPDYWQRHTAHKGLLGTYRDVDAFADQAAQSGFKVVSLVEPFEAAGSDGTPLSLMPIDRHWNAAANELAARTVADFISAKTVGMSAAGAPRE